MEEPDLDELNEKRLLTLNEAARYCGISSKAFLREFPFTEHRFSTTNKRCFDRYLIDEVIDKAVRKPVKRGRSVLFDQKPNTASGLAQFWHNR